MRYEDLDRHKITMFKIVRSDGQIVYSAPFDGNGDKLLWRRRRSLNLVGFEQELHILAIANGTVVAVNPQDSSALHAPGFDKNDPMLYPPVLLPGEPGFIPDTL